jgi:hypothetical protein
MQLNTLGRVLRTIALILIGLTASFNVLGGIGKVCAAFMTRQFPPMWALLEYQWLYQVIMVVTLAAGLAGIWAAIQLARSKPKALQFTIMALLAAIVITGINVFASLSLREKAAPSDIRLYVNLFTLGFLLILQLPGLRERVSFTKDAPPIDRSTSGGLAAIAAGIVVLTVHLWAGPSHTYMGTNWVDVLILPLMLVGWGLVIWGAILLSKVVVAIFKEEFTSRKPALDH